MKRKPNDPAFQAQLDNGLRAIDALKAIAVIEANDNGDPLAGIAGTDVERENVEDYTVVAERDFTGMTEPNPPSDGHATQAVGLFGPERDNNIGIGSLSESPVAVAQFSSEESDRSSPVRVREAIEWLVDEGVDVINLSWSFGRFFGDSLFKALEYARENGVLVVTSAGNEGTNKPRLTYPHAFDMDNMVTVTATEGNSDHLAEFSNFNREWVDIAAPGSPLVSYTPDPLFGDEPNPDAPWDLVYVWGTSFAAPLVADVALAMMRVNPDLRGRPELVRELLMATADDIDVRGPAKGRIGSGRVNAYKAVLAAADPLAYLADPDA